VELLNFGALLAFMGVNASAFFHYFVREGKRTVYNFFMPTAGFLTCLLLWWSLSWRAKLLALFGWLWASPMRLQHPGIQERSYDF